MVEDEETTGTQHKRDLRSDMGKAGYGGDNFHSDLCNRIRGVWIPDKTLLRVFDTASQTDHQMQRKQRHKIVKISVN